MSADLPGRRPHPEPDPHRNGQADKPLGLSPAKESSAWVDRNSSREKEMKYGIALYAATHLLDYGNSLLIGAGTTLTCLMREIMKRLTSSEHHPVEPLDLLIVTNNIGVFDEGREAQQKHHGILGNTSVVLTGGSYHASMYSLMGEYAAGAVRSDRFYPDLVFFGARGLCFDDDLTIRYQFQEELSTQASFATRQTAHRVLLIDHTKLGARSGWKLEAINARTMLEHTPLFTIISTYPERLPAEADHRDRAAVDAQRAAVDVQFEACGALFKRLAARPEFAEKELVLRLVNQHGTVVKEQRLSQYRQPAAAELNERRPVAATR